MVRVGAGGVEGAWDVLRESISAAFGEAGLDDPEELRLELEGKRRLLERGVLLGPGESGWFAVEVEGVLVGVAAFFPASEFLRRHCEEVRFAEPGARPEVGAVYVRPGWQGRGVGIALVRRVLEELLERGVSRFCLDAGLPRALGYWRHRLGPPDRVLADFWGPGSDHGIWSPEVVAALARLPPQNPGSDFA